MASFFSRTRNLKAGVDGSSRDGLRLAWLFPHCPSLMAARRQLQPWPPCPCSRKKGTSRQHQRLLKAATRKVCASPEFPRAPPRLGGQCVSSVHRSTSRVRCSRCPRLAHAQTPRLFSVPLNLDRPCLCSSSNSCSFPLLPRHLSQITQRLACHRNPREGEATSKEGPGAPRLQPQREGGHPGGRPQPSPHTWATAWSRGATWLVLPAA